ncbi:MAG: tetratricopeptide repeat protein [Nitrospinales bacterium]
MHVTNDTDNFFGNLSLRAALLAAVLLPTLLVFSFSLNCGFVWDDGRYIQKNPIIKAITTENLYKMVRGDQSPTWHPLTWLSHAVDYRLYRLNPAGHHLSNLIVYVLATACVFYLFALLLRTAAPARSDTAVLVGAALGALLFAIHPLRVESVVWIAERKGLLAGLFFCLSLIAWVRYAQVAGSARRIRYAAALGFFLLALMSKPTVVMLPVVLLLLDVFPLNRFRGRESGFRIFLEKVPFFALSLIAGILAIKGEAEGKALTSFQVLSLGDRLVHMVRSWAFYVEKTLFPTQLTPFYPIPADASVFSVSFLSALALTAGLTGAAIWQWRRGRPLWLGAWLYYLAAGLPIIGIIHAGRHLMADRYSYLPTLSFYFLAAAGMAKLLDGKRFAGPTLAVAVTVIALFASLSLHQINVWSNPLAFWRHVTAVFPDRIPIAHNNLGDVYLSKGYYKDAEKEFKTALRALPEFPIALVNLGKVYARTNRFEEAETILRKAIAMAPGSLPGHSVLAKFFVQRGLLDAAEKEFKIALKIQPDSADDHNNLGGVYRAKGLYRQAEREYEAAYKVDPDFEIALINLITLYREMSALKIRPNGKKEGGHE